VLLIKEDTYLR